MNQISKNDEEAAWLSRWVGKGLGRVGGAKQFPLGGRRVRLWRSVETGEGAPSVRKNIYLYYLSCRISRVLENWRSEFPNFLHAAPYWNSKDTLLPRFAKILLCVDL